MKTAARVLVEQLAVHGVKHIFCVPGESYLAVLDALYDSDIALTVCRQEGGAAMMADAAGKSTGRPGICFVTRGPGATNAAIGIHIAQQDSTPLIMFVGQIARGFRGRDAFQELDYRAVFGGMAKWATEIDDPARVPEIVSRAFSVATSGRPGPVVVALPEDMLGEEVDVPLAPAFVPVEAWPGAADMAALKGLLEKAKRPILIAGGSLWSEAARQSLHRFSEHFALPVVTSYRRLPLFDPLHPNYAGDLGIGPNPKLIERLKAADLVILAGGRLSEIPSQAYTLFDIPNPKPVFVHVHAGVEELGRVYRPALAIHATPSAFAAMAEAMTPPAALRARDETEAAHADYRAWTDVATPQPGEVNLGEIMVWLRENLPPDAILCNGAGNYAAWIHRFYRFRRLGTHIAPLAASMGYGIPAAVAMKRLHPGRVVVSLNGDGDFLMNGQEFATARHYGLNFVAIVCDNGSYGTIRMHQEREYPGRVIATALTNPDFASLAESYGGAGFTVRRTAEFPDAFRAASGAGKPAIIHVKIDPQAATPGMSLEKIAAKGREERAARR